MTGNKSIRLIAAITIVMIAAGIAMYRNGSFFGNGDAEVAEVRGTRAPVPENLFVPDENTTEAPAGVAIPEATLPAAPTTNVQYRVFNLQVLEGRFVPDTINVPGGDIVRLNIHAVDADYDFAQPDYGLQADLPQGETRVIQFGSTSGGSFLFYCVSCGGPNQGPVGTLNITEK